MNEPTNFDSDLDFCSNKPCYYLKCPNSKYDEIDARISESFNRKVNNQIVCERTR